MPKEEEFLSRGETTSMSFSIVPVFLREVFFDFIFFVLWWYTSGLKRILNGLYNEFLKTLRRLSLRIFFKNLFKPLYGDYTKMGRAIGVTIRLILFIILIIMAFIWFVLLIVILMGWIIALPLFLYFLFRQFF